MVDEKRVIESCIKGNRKAQYELYDTFSRKMMSVCLRYMGDYESAQDVLQEGFIRLFANLGSFQFNGSFDGWVRRIFVNTALEQLRKNDILHNAADIGLTQADLLHHDHSVIDELSANDILKVINELPMGFRTVFNMFAIEGYSHKEIADALGITESTSRSQFTRAKQILQKKLTNDTSIHE